ncbi:MAG: hypothetical protein OXH95_05400, partial [bacterium]|nr:hypothetical protein [bacterium]
GDRRPETGDRRPETGDRNQVIYITGPGASVGFSTLVSDSPPDLHLLSGGQAFPRYTYPKTSR